MIYTDSTLLCRLPAGQVQTFRSLHVYGVKRAADPISIKKLVLPVDKAAERALLLLAASLIVS